MKRLAHVLAHALLWFGAWLLFVWKTEWDELLVGALCALLAGVASDVAWGARLLRFGTSWRALSQAVHIPRMCLAGTYEIAKVLARQLLFGRPAGSHLFEVPFDGGAANDPADVARRALAVAYTTMTPNFVIVGIDLEAGTMLYHQLERTDVPRMTRNLGARP